MPSRSPIRRTREVPRAGRRPAPRRLVRADYNRLVRAARAARRRAYAPYSRFPVGAAVLTADGWIFAGANVENASYGLTHCAERVAVHTAVAAGHRRLRAVAIAGPDGITPCGACRQVMAEFGVRIVLLAGPAGSPAVVPLAELLPLPFTSARFGRRRRPVQGRPRTRSQSGRAPRSRGGRRAGL